MPDVPIAKFLPNSRFCHGATWSSKIGTVVVPFQTQAGGKWRFLDRKEVGVHMGFGKPMHRWRLELSR